MNTNPQPEKKREEDLGALKVPPKMFYSRSEAAIAELFRRYIPGWHPRLGDTVQVQIGGGRTVDFRVGDTLLEYHPVVIVREMQSSQALGVFKRLYARGDRYLRQQLIELLETELGAQYANRRAQLVAVSPLKDLHLVVAHDFHEVYRCVLLRYGERLPAFQVVKSQFQNLVTHGA